MKNKLLKGIFGIGIFALALNVNAASLNSVESGSNASSHDVTVGSVDAPVYSVDISWGSLKFDWTYNSTSNTYEWSNSKIENCGLAINEEMNPPMDSSENTNVWKQYSEAEFEELLSTSKVYSDSTCQVIAENVTYEELANDNYYTIQTSYSSSDIFITDSSVGAEIVPSIEWNSKSDYEFVQGKFLYESAYVRAGLVDNEEEFNLALNAGMLYYDEELTNQVTDTTTAYEEGVYYMRESGTEFPYLTTTAIPDSGRFNARGNGDEEYHVILELHNDTSKNIKTPKAGDVIGTVTISIAAK